jgi:hypothetical protein
MNKFEQALERIKKYVEPQDQWTEEDWEHYKTIIEALEIASKQADHQTEKGGDGKMIKLTNWNEITKGLYRYVISANVCYEIHILYHAKETDILTAKSSLYIVGDWFDKDRNSFFERECLLTEQPLSECLEKAYQDNEEYNK